MTDETRPMEIPRQVSGPQIPAGSHVVIRVSKGPATSATGTAEIPSLIDTKQQDAIAAAQDAGFQVELVRNHNAAFKAGMVSHQIPIPGTIASAGSKICIIVSDGPAAKDAAMTVLPDVVGRTDVEAQNTLRDCTLLTSVIEDFSPSVPAGIVMAQEPNASDIGREPKKGGLLWLWILLLVLLLALGAWWFFFRTVEPATVPDLNGMTVEQAETALTDAGFALGRESTEETDAADPGLVVAQDPAAGDEADKGSRVDIVVAEAIAGVEVPDVVGMDQDKAESTLTDSDLTSTVTKSYDDKVASGKVISQSPQPGVRVEKGTEVAIKVSKGPKPASNVSVPNVSGMTRSAAEKALSDAGLKSQTLLAYSATVPADQVMGQAPAGGSEVAPGTQVTILVSQGPAPSSSTDVTVPNVVGMSRSDADAALSDAGLKAEFVEQVSDSVPADEVMVQIPAAGETTVEGGSVVVVVSTGP